MGSSSKEAMLSSFLVERQVSNPIVKNGPICTILDHISEYIL